MLKIVLRELAQKLNPASLGKKKNSFKAGGFQAPLQFLEPAPDKLVMLAWRYLIPLYVRKINRVERCQLENGEGLVKAFNQFYRGECRLLLAFRHPSMDDPSVLYKVVVRDLEKLARKMKQPLPVHPNLFFMYSRGLPLWAGRYLEWLLPRMGATPIFRGQADRSGLSSALKVMLDGEHPMAVAPEGTINSKNWEVKTLESGLIKIATMAQKALLERNSRVPVIILPVGIAYLYPNPPWNELDKLLDELEGSLVAGTRFDSPEGQQEGENKLFELEDWLPPGGELPSEPALRTRYQRFIKIYAAMLSTLEEHYWTHYHKKPAPKGASPEERSERLVDNVLHVAEERLLIKGEGRPFKRIQKIEAAAWARQYRKAPSNLAQEGIAHWLSRESRLSALHTWIVYGLYDIKLSYLFHDPSFERLTETTLLVWDVLSTCLGIKATARPILGPRIARLAVGEPLVIGPRVPSCAPTGEKVNGRKLEFEKLCYNLETELNRLAP